MITGYLYPPTWLHRVPAGLKLVGLALVASASFVLDSWEVFAVLLALIAGAYILLGAQAIRRLRSLKPLIYVLAVVYAAQWYVSGHEQAFVSVGRLVTMILLADLVTMTTPLQAMLDALRPVFRIFEPIGLKSRKLSLAVALVIRFVPVLFELWSRRSEAWRARSARRIPPKQLALFLFDSLRNSDRIAEALDARGYGRSSQ